MEPEDSLSHSHASAACPYPVPHKYSPCLPIPLLDDPFPLFHCLSRKTRSVQIRVPVKYLVATQILTVRRCLHLAQPPSWGTTPCQPSATGYSIYPQLPSTSKGRPPTCNTRTRDVLLTGTYHGFVSSFKGENSWRIHHHSDHACVCPFGYRNCGLTHKTCC